jgi:hypothetical protein
MGIVIVVVVVLAAVVAVFTLLARTRAYDEIGRGALSLRDERDAAPAHEPSPAQRDEEIRQLLAARNARRARRGQPPLDVEAELGRLTRLAAAPELRDEVRQLVLARNARRRRQGKPELDVETEVERQLRELAQA